MRGPTLLLQIVKTTYSYAKFFSGELKRGISSRRHFVACYNISLHWDQNTNILSIKFSPYQTQTLEALFSKRAKWKVSSGLQFYCSTHAVAYVNAVYKYRDLWGCLCIKVDVQSGFLTHPTPYNCQFVCSEAAVTVLFITCHVGCYHTHRLCAGHIQTRYARNLGEGRSTVTISLNQTKVWHCGQVWSHSNHSLLLYCVKSHWHQISPLFVYIELSPHFFLLYVFLWGYLSSNSK